MQKSPQQLTFSSHGHTLHHNQVQSFDGNYLVFDYRNDDTKIGETNTIAILDLKMNQEQIMYQTKNSSLFGPGIGAATFCPNENIIIFIHGIQNANDSKPYSMTRRTGVSVNLNKPNVPIFMDARNIYPPFTKGALRGGSHSHAWHPSKKLISFTYNDYYLEQNCVLDKDTRVVGVMFPKKVEVPLDDLGENNSGEMFSVIVSDVKNRAKQNSDEIEKAFDECWLGNKNEIVFQAWVRDENDEIKTEIYLCKLPDDLSIENVNPLQGTLQNRCGVPKNVKQIRLTNSKGISGFRHWLRTDENGDFVYFLMEDANNITQIFCVEVTTKIVSQITNHQHSIHSPFNIKNNLLVYFNNNELVLFNMDTKNYKSLFTTNKEIVLTGIPHFCNKSNVIYFNAFVNNTIQIFKIEC